MIIATEKTFECSDGVTLATCHWSNSDIPKTNNGPSKLSSSSSAATAALMSSSKSPTRRILCLHGWLDNAASFYRLAPLLLDTTSISSASKASSAAARISLDVPSTEIVALDFPGHGKSSHKSVDGPPQLLAEYAYYVAELVEALQWGKNDDGEGGNAGGSGSSSTTAIDTPINKNKIILVGHSMGAGVATILCAAFPEWFSSLILLEGGLVARNAEDAARHVRAACQRRLKSNRTLFPNNHRGVVLGTVAEESELPVPSPRAKVYSDLDVAIKARLSTTERMPGDQSLSYEAARELVLRATTPAEVSTSASSDPSSESVVFIHDPRLQWPSLQYYTREQVEAFYRDVQASQIPVCCLVATDGWPVESWAENLVINVLKPVYFKKLSGSHHFHADPDSVHAVAKDLLTFLVEQKL